jgi:hypothetical protein
MEELPWHSYEKVDYFSREIVYFVIRELVLLEMLVSFGL